jgi:hypothetical protein
MTAARHEQIPHSGDESEPLGDISPAWSPEQPGEKGTDMTPHEMEDFEEGVVHGNPDSDTVPPPPASPD